MDRWETRTNPAGFCWCTTKAQCAGSGWLRAHPNSAMNHKEFLWFLPLRSVELHGLGRLIAFVLSNFGDWCTEESLTMWSPSCPQRWKNWRSSALTSFTRWNCLCYGDDLCCVVQRRQPSDGFHEWRCGSNKRKCDEAGERRGIVCWFLSVPRKHLGACQFALYEKKGLSQNNTLSYIDVLNHLSQSLVSTSKVQYRKLCRQRLTSQKMRTDEKENKILHYSWAPSTKYDWNK